MKISNLTSEYLELGESWGNGLGFNSNIDIIRVYDKNGNTLSFSTKQYDFGDSRKPKVWNINLDGKKEIIAEYERPRNVLRKI